MKKIRKGNVVLRVADEQVNAYLKEGFKEVKGKEPKKEEKKQLPPAGGKEPGKEPKKEDEK